MKRILLSILFMLVCSFAFSQEGIRGKVTDKQGVPLPGVTIVVEGTTIGVQTDSEGNYSISAKAGDVLVFSYIGMVTQQIKVTSQTQANVQMDEDVKALDEVVVTALGIEREKKALGYAVQKVDAEELVTVKSGNIANALSGKVAGLNIRRNSNFGGSTNIVIRGYNSLSGNSQALFVVDGIPISNRNSNAQTQAEASSGYDYGNAGMDINPEDVESIEVLKGGAASALYGSLAANGVVMITTKKGRQGKTSVNVSSTTTVGMINKNTFPAYQSQYGAGYGIGAYDKLGDGDDNKYWYLGDFDGDGKNDFEYVPTSEDASWGAPFDGRQVYHWNSLYPQLSTYKQSAPWQAAKNGPITFFETPITLSNTVSLQGGDDKMIYRLGYTRFDQKGILPNSKWDKNNLSFASSYKFSDKFSVSTSVNYTYQNTVGRNSTGYNNNIVTSFRQWWQTNVDMKDLQSAYNATEKNISWNPANYEAVLNGDVPIYWDNPYFDRHKNYQSDNRGRWIANVNLDYKIIDKEDTKVSAVLQLATDTYSELQEERLAHGSNPKAFGIGIGTDGSSGRSEMTSGYLRRDISSKIFHYNFIVNFKQKISNQIGLSGLAGATVRRNYFNRVISATNGGLDFEGVYSLQNSKNPLVPSLERDERQFLNGVYANATIDYKDFFYLDLAIRADQSSTLPNGANTYLYPSVSGSFIFSEFINSSVLSFGKLRGNWAQVGNATGFDLLNDSYDKLVGINGASSRPSSTKRNSELRPERQTSVELGLETKFFKNKLGLDVAVYQNNTKDQITPVSVPSSVGYSYKYVNAGEIQNRGLEISISSNEIDIGGRVRWSSSLNWSKNISEVLSLAGGANSLLLGVMANGATVNAVVGQPFGTIYGSDYIYQGGQKVVDPQTGYYRRTSTSNSVLGSQIPKWIMGFRNSFSYKNFNLGFLVDTQYGGSIFSLDMAYGMATGIYPETAFVNDLGNPVRNPVSMGGGYVNPGVNPDGTQNTTRAEATYGAFGYVRNPNAAFVYDASYVKLRELSLGYSIPLKNQKLFKAAKVGVVGSNLFIFYKNLPHADPENGLSSGALQAFSIGSLPTFREISFNVSLTF